MQNTTTTEKPAQTQKPATDKDARDIKTDKKDSGCGCGHSH